VSEELCLKTAEELRALIVSRAVSPVEIVDAVLARIERLQPALNCFITVCADEARAVARESATRLARGEPPRLLEGIPFSCKDLIDTAGVRTTFGSLINKNNVPASDAVAVARLKAAGAVLVGKTTTPEYGHKAFTDAPLFGRTRNAWSAARSCAGSSGGAACAVACGLAPLALATDGGGSTRIPAAANGVVGIKQTVGVIPHSQAPDPFGSYTYVTPTTRTVADTALMMQAMAGPYANDPWSYAPVDDYAAVAARARLDGVRIALLPRLGNTVVSHEVLAALDRSAQLLSQAGAIVEPLDEVFEPIEPLWRIINHSTWRARFSALVDRHRDIMTPTLVRQVDEAQAYSATDFQLAAFKRGALFRTIQGWLERYDALLMPTLTRTALPIENNLFDPIDIDGQSMPEVRAAWFPYTMPFNLTGHPAITLPIGLGSDGLPLAAQLVGRFRRDADLLCLAATLEARCGWNRRLAPIAA
jgi:aspartyl-tRNA(Asn)/glutamyl-tRNA(Gln) amidotransferase subunit A